MYYEEALIDGVWSWRNNPDGTWIPMGYKKLHNKINDLENKLGSILNHLENCHDDFRARKHGGVAEQKLRHGIESVFGVSYD